MTTKCDLQADDNTGTEFSYLHYDRFLATRSIIHQDVVLEMGLCTWGQKPPESNGFGAPIVDSPPRNLGVAYRG